MQNTYDLNPDYTPRIRRQTLGSQSPFLSYSELVARDFFQHGLGRSLGSIVYIILNYFFLNSRVTIVKL